jgi:hypothetical protein
MTAKRKIIREPIGDVEPEISADVLSAEPSRSEFALITREVLEDKIRALGERSTIRNDKGDIVPFDGEAKEAFIKEFRKGYPILEKTLTGLYELGKFLDGAREELKPHKLYHAWLDYAGIPRGTAQSYVQAYGRYGDKLPRFAGLGIRKLLIASRLPECADFVEEHEQQIASQTTEELEAQVKKLREPKQIKDTKVGRKPTYISVGSYRIRPSGDGTKITIEGLSGPEQAKLIEAIKEMLSQGKD